MIRLVIIHNPFIQLSRTCPGYHHWPAGANSFFKFSQFPVFVKQQGIPAPIYPQTNIAKPAQRQTPCVSCVCSLRFSFAAAYGCLYERLATRPDIVVLLTVWRAGAPIIKLNGKSRFMGTWDTKKSVGT